MRDDGCQEKTILQYHNLLHGACGWAEKQDILLRNPFDRVDRPKTTKYSASYYTPEQLQTLIKLAEGENLYIPIVLAAYYGLRRSEVLGLKWSAIDFTGKTICIRHKVVEEDVGPVGYDVMKTKSSYRTLPLLPFIEDELLKEKAKQKEMKQVMRRDYNTDYE